MDARGILKVLADTNVRFVVIGGVAAVLQGVPGLTNDVDIVHARDPENRRRLIDALRQLEAHYRQHRTVRIEPKEEDLGLPGTHLLTTRLGALDLVGRTTGGAGYEELVGRAKLMDVGQGLHVHVVDLELLIEMKEVLGRDKDRARLPDYRRTLEERNKREGRQKDPPRST